MGSVVYFYSIRMKNLAYILILNFLISIHAVVTNTTMDNSRIFQTIQSNDPKDINYLVYTDPSNPSNYKKLTIGSQTSLKESNLKPGPLKLLLSGFGSPNMESEAYKNAYLASGVSNLIIVDWSKLATSKLPDPLVIVSYFEASRNVAKVGVKTAKLLQFLYANGILEDYGDAHCLGASLGAHVCGSIGWQTYKLTGSKIGRVSGLDPAGPFNKLLKENKLNVRDAKFVDALHSNIDGLGSPERFGHADFYINGGKGKNIPGCEGMDLVSGAFCAHTAAWKLFVHSIEGRDYEGCRCAQVYRGWPCAKPNACKDQAVAGETCSVKTRGKFYLETEDNLATDP